LDSKQNELNETRKLLEESEKARGELRASLAESAEKIKIEKDRIIKMQSNVVEENKELTKKNAELLKELSDMHKENNDLISQNNELMAVKKNLENELFSIKSLLKSKNEESESYSKIILQNKETINILQTKFQNMLSDFEKFKENSINSQKDIGAKLEAKNNEINEKIIQNNSLANSIKSFFIKVSLK